MIMPIKKIFILAGVLGFGVMTSQWAVAQANCTYRVSNEWNTGATGEIIITNKGSSAINGWTVSWQYITNRLSGSWNANVNGSNPYTASNLGWNANILPGQSVAFGFQINKNGGIAEVPQITGNVCSGVASSSAPSSVVSSSSLRSSVASSINSSVRSSSSIASGQRCNWYGTLYPLCVTTQIGWGWENSQSCISRSTCAAQPAPYGIVNGSSASSSSLVSSSSVSSRSSISSSSLWSSSSLQSSSSSVRSSSSVMSSSSSIRSSVVSSSSSVSSINNGVRLDNPFVGASKWYINQDWSEKATASGGAAIAGVSTAVWMDRIGAIDPEDPNVLGLRDHLDAALDQGANLFMVVIYDLPNRDCFALASNGELSIAQNGFNRYKNEYINPIASILSDSKYRNLRIIAIIEPDSLPNLVTNTATPKCQEAAGPGGYIEATQYTLNTLYPITNVYSYVDIGHSGWLGWPDNFDKAITLIGNAIKGTANGVNSIAGFVSNTAGYTPNYEPFLDQLANSAMPGSNGGTQVRQAKFYEWNPVFSEVAYVQAWRTKMIAAGFPASIGMLIDTSRNGWGGAGRPTAQSTSTNVDTFVNESRVDRRNHRGNWCNQPGGIGERPQATPAPGIDAYVWVKPPGESDGVGSAGIIDPQDPAKGFDRFCDPTFTTAGGALTGAIPNAPHAGRWFPEAFQILIDNAYPPLD